MHPFFETLESRTFLSAVTTTILNVDQAAIVSAGANGNTALKALLADIKTGVTAITADLKTLPKTNAPLLVTLKADVARFEATVSTDLGLLIKPGEALAKKSTATGQSLFVKATTKNVTVAAAEITALGTVTTAPLANLLAAFHGNNVGADFQALITANPTATQLATDITTANTNANAQITALQNAANQFATNITTLATDLTSVKTTFGTFPNMVGTFNGTASITKGENAGGTDDIIVVITSQDAAGNLTGTSINTTQGDVFTLQGTVTLNGGLAATLINSVVHNVTITGQFNNATIAGSFKTFHNSGTFIVTKAP